MTIKLAVASRLENLTSEGVMTNVILAVDSTTAKDEKSLLFRMEIGRMDVDMAKNFPIGRVLEITIPTYGTNNRSNLVIVPK